VGVIGRTTELINHSNASLEWEKGRWSGCDRRIIVSLKSKKIYIKIGNLYGRFLTSSEHWLE
jgi:hypothetical protein